MNAIEEHVARRKQDGLSCWAPSGAEERSAFAWALARPDGEDIDELHKRSPWGPEQVHPKRLLAELADEFDGRARL